MTREEAIEIVKKHGISADGTKFESALRELIPELAESEDRDSNYGVFPEDVIVVARACEKLEAHGYPELAHALKNVNLYTKEQKPADLSDMMVHKEPYIAPVPTPMVADEQKPAEWSEEDENMRESAIALIRKWTNYSGENVGDSIKVISWLQWLPLLAHQH